MRQSMPDTHGWVDCGPIQRDTRSADRSVRETIEQGKDRPRPLTRAETTLANRNRKIAMGDMYSVVEWEARGFVGGPPDEKRTWTNDDPGISLPADYGNFSYGMLEPQDEDVDARPWVAVNRVLKVMDTMEHHAWADIDPDVEDAVSGNVGTAGCTKHRLEQAPGERGSGITGLTGDYYVARKAMRG